MNENDKQGAAWPCKIIESDFEQNTITVQMQNKDYFVSGGTFWLSMHKQAEPVHPPTEVVRELINLLSEYVAADLDALELNPRKRSAIAVLTKAKEHGL